MNRRIGSGDALSAWPRAAVASFWPLAHICAFKRSMGDAAEQADPLVAQGRLRS